MTAQRDGCLFFLISFQFSIYIFIDRYFYEAKTWDGVKCVLHSFSFQIHFIVYLFSMNMVLFTFPTAFRTVLKYGDRPKKLLLIMLLAFTLTTLTVSKGTCAFN